MPKQYFFEAGTFPDLSYTELSCVFKSFNINRDSIHRFSDKILLIKNNSISEEIINKVFSKLGGFVRYGYIIDEPDSFLEQYLKKSERVTFGVSALGFGSRDEQIFLRKLATGIKDELKKNNVSARFVKPTNRDTELNAAQVVNNDILEKGFELCIMKNGNEELYGTTLGIQSIEEFAARDLDKPYTDTKMGTLPPKLARIMVNLTGLKEGIIWDPFCGSGTIPMEAAVLGLDILGSDIDPQAVEYTEKNIEWLADKGQIGNIMYDVFQMDVYNPHPKTLSKLKHTEISALICEPFMGPPQHNTLFTNRAEILLKRVKDLYTALFDILDRTIHEGFVAVIIVPSYKTKAGWRTFGIRDIVGKRWDILNGEYSGGKDLKWSRKNSIITRNIFILRKK